jgi:terminase, large subunit
MLTGSNSGASYRSESIKYLVIDDFDGFEVDIEGEGSPEELADRRTGTFPNRKIYLNSTTTTKDLSNIERAFEHSSQGYFHVPCPHCGGFQYLVWGGKDADHGIKFKRDAGGIVRDAWYICEHCHERIDEHHKTTMTERGIYVHKYPDRPVHGYRYNALVSPAGWINGWKYIAQKFVEAVHDLRQGNPEKYQVWLNSFMSEPYEQTGDRPEWAEIKAKAEPYQPLTVPQGALILSAGTDVQHNRLAVSIWAWGKGEESWLVYHIEIAGDPMHGDVWEQHDQLINGTFTRTDGVQMHVLSAGVDAGDGATTQAVRNYCRTRAPRVFALKGSSSPARPVIGIPTKQDVTWKGEKIEDGVEMWPIGTDTAKSTIYSRLKISEPGSGRIHTYIGLDDEYYEQLTAEKLITRFVKGYPVREWHNVRGNKRNEVLDCVVYAYAAAIRAGLPYLDLQKDKEQKPRPRPRTSTQTKRRRW